VTPPIGRTTKDPLKSNLDSKIQGNSLEISQNFEACNTKVYSKFVKFDASLTKMKDNLNTYQRLSTLNSKPSRFTYTDVYKKNVATNVNAWSVASNSIDREASCSFHNLRIKPNIGSALSNQNQYLENKVQNNFNSDFPQSSENSKRISDNTDRLKVRSKEEKKVISKDSADIGGVTSSRNLEHGTKETVNKRKKESTVARPSKIEKQELIYETVGSKKQMKGASNAKRYGFRPIDSSPLKDKVENTENILKDFIASSTRRVYSKKNLSSRVTKQNSQNTKKDIEREQWETLQSSHFEDVGDVELSFL